MPRININEKDRTSPGTPGGYANNTVLIAGFSTRTTDEIIKAMEKDKTLGYILPDDNGIFEFESSDDFAKTIGLVAPECTQTANDYDVSNDDELVDIVDDKWTNKVPAHYGNQMAYELLKMGYPIIYVNLGPTYELVDVPKLDAEGDPMFDSSGKPVYVQVSKKDKYGQLVKDEYGNIIYENVKESHIIAGESMKKLGSFADTWEIFKDKASYDFRFISHGLLTSSEIAKSDDLINLEARVAKMQEFFDKAIEKSQLNEFTELAERAAILKTFKPEALTYDEQTQLANYKEFFDKVPEKKIKVKVDENKKPLLDENGKYILAEEGEDGVEVTLDKTEEEVFKILEEAAFDLIKKYEKDFMYDKYKRLTDPAKIIEYIEAKFEESKDPTATNFQNAKTALDTEQQLLIDVYEKEGEDAFTEKDFANANAAIAKLAHYKAVVDAYGNEDEMDPESGRGDCTALIEVDESKYIIKDGTRPEILLVSAINEMTDINADNGKYCACTVPSVVYKMTDDERFGKNKKFPGAFHYLACFKNSIGLGFAEWYAAAGYTRGVASYAIDHTTVKLGEIAIQALEPRYIKDQDEEPKFAVNVIANFRGNYYLWGNRTCHPLGTYAGGNDLVASHFLNIRQLCTTIKKQLYVSCRRFTFDPNSDVLWINFKNSIIPMLERMKADQGVRDFKIEKVYTDKKATLKAKIRIVPIEAVEDFLLEVSLEDSLGETNVTITE